MSASSLLTYLAHVVSHASLHTADPGDDGANEVTGGGYRRATVRFNPPLDGIITNLTEVNFDDLPNLTANFLGLWAGEWFLWSNPLLGPVVVENGGTLRVYEGKLNFVMD